MKLSLIVLASVFGLTLGSAIGIAQATEDRPQVTQVKAPVSEEVPNRPVVEEAPAVIRVHEVVIVAQRPQVKVAQRVWVCGPMHDNQIGGRNADCEWK